MPSHVWKRTKWSTHFSTKFKHICSKKRKGNKQETWVLFQDSQVGHRAPVTPKAAPLCLVLSICLFPTSISSPYPCSLQLPNSSLQFLYLSRQFQFLTPDWVRARIFGFNTFFHTGQKTSVPTIKLFKIISNCK